MRVGTWQMGWFVSLVACGGNPSGGVNVGGNLVDTGVADTNVGYAFDGSAPQCTTATDCGPGLRCSAVRTCVAEGACADDVECPEGHTCDLATSSCVVGSACGAEEFASTRVTPNVLVVLDRSCSMLAPSGDPSGRTKWEAAVSILTALTTANEGLVEFGLVGFPDTDIDQCGQGEVAVPVSAEGGAQIRALLATSLAATSSFYPDGPCVTNISAGLTQASTLPALMDPSRPSYVLLLSDGAEGFCGNPRVADERSRTTLSAMAARGVRTYVVGFGLDTDEAALSSFAAAGGTARAGASLPYYQANDEPALRMALGEILGGVLSCDFALAEPPESLDRVFLFFDDSQSVPHDAVNGWEYVPATQTVSLFGTSCDALRSGAVHDVDIVYGCPEPILE